MKSSRMLFLLVGTMMVTPGMVKAGSSLRPYIIGSMKDKKNRTLHHVAAKNCDCLEEFSMDFALQTIMFAMSGIELSTEEAPSILEKDSKGRTARDIAEKMYEKTGHQGCKDAIFGFEKLEKAEKDELEALKEVLDSSENKN